MIAFRGEIPFSESLELNEVLLDSVDVELGGSGVVEDSFSSPLFCGLDSSEISI